MRLRLLLTTALVVPALIACASKDGGNAQKNDTIGQKPIDVVRAAAEKTIDAGSARMSMTMEGPGMSMTASGVTATDKVLGSMTMTMNAGGQKIDMEMRMLGQVMYMKMPGLPTGGKPWAKIDIEALSKQGNVDLAALSQIQQNDPKQALAYMRGMSDDVKEVGTEDVRGTATTKYEGTLDMNAAAKAQTDARVRAAIESVVKQLGTAKIPTTLWIDAEGRMRKMVQTIDLSATGGGASGTMTTTIEMYDFGVAVDVKAPPENEVGDGSALFGGGS